MKSEKLEALCLGALIGVVFMLVMFCIFITLLPAKRTSEPQRYDLGCLTEYNKSPLTECKEKAKK